MPDMNPLMNPRGTMRAIHLLISSLAVTATLLAAAPEKTARLPAADKEPVRIVCMGFEPPNPPAQGLQECGRVEKANS